MTRLVVQGGMGHPPEIWPDQRDDGEQWDYIAQRPISDGDAIARAEMLASLMADLMRLEEE